MGISRRLRNIAISQVNALKERLDRIDEEAKEEEASRKSAVDARAELSDPTDIRPTARRSPEEIAAGVPVTETRPAPAPHPAAPAAPPNPLAVHFRRLGVPEGSDLSTIEAAYSSLVSRCAPDRFPEGSAERAAAAEILTKVEQSYHALRDSLDPTAGRFDKLEL